MEDFIKLNDKGIYNPDVVKCDVYVHHVTAKYYGHINIYLRDDENFHFTVSAGHTSDSSYSGCFFGHPEIKTLEDAMNAIKKKHPEYF